MLVLSKIKFIISFVYFCLFIKVKLTNYISLELDNVDDCVRLVNISNEILFNFTPEYDGHCDACKEEMYPKDKYLVKNYEYKFKVEIEITLEDWDHHYGGMRMNVYFNEFKIKSSDKVFWECINCGNGTENYFWHDDRMNFYPDIGDKEKNEKLYIFVFKIDDITDLYKGGENGAFEVYEFYSFTDEEIFQREIYSTENQLELINFNVAEILHTKSNISLPIDYNNYYFKIEYEENKIKGDLKGLDLNGEETELDNGKKFKINDTYGLNYVLTGEEKNNRSTVVKVKISVCNYCEDGINGYHCQNNVIVPSKEFTFIIKVIDPPTTTPLTETPHYYSDN